MRFAAQKSARLATILRKFHVELRTNFGIFAAIFARDRRAQPAEMIANHADVHCTTLNYSKAPAWWQAACLRIFAVISAKNSRQTFARFAAIFCEKSVRIAPQRNADRAHVCHVDFASSLSLARGHGAFCSANICASRDDFAEISRRTSHDFWNLWRDLRARSARAACRNDCKPCLRSLND